MRMVQRRWQKLAVAGRGQQWSIGARGSFLPAATTGQGGRDAMLLPAVHRGTSLSGYFSPLPSLPLLALSRSHSSYTSPTPVHFKRSPLPDSSGHPQRSSQNSCRRHHSSSHPGRFTLCFHTLPQLQNTRCTRTCNCNRPTNNTASSLVPRRPLTLCYYSPLSTPQKAIGVDTPGLPSTSLGHLSSHCRLFHCPQLNSSAPFRNLK